MYGEESEWCHRIARAGWVVRYHPGVEIMHHGGASTTSLSVWRTIEVAKGHLLFLRFTRSTLTARAAALGMAGRDAAKLAIGAIRRRPSDGERAAILARLRFALTAIAKPPEGQSLGRPAHRAKP